jgi:class 3 adenylate cyclase
MTRLEDILAIERKLVIVIDICSSTAILEDLAQTDNIHKWRNVLIGLKQFLCEDGAKIGAELYKFIGDGWIVLLPPAITKYQLCEFLTSASVFYDTQLDSILPLLQRTPKVLGLTFGVDAGNLVRLVMNEQVEYLGRAINVAARLQSAAKSLDKDPRDRVVFSKNSFNSLHPINHDIPVHTVSVSLKNVGNGAETECLAYRVL